MQTDKLEYDIPMVYSRGFLAFRVRPVGRWVDTPESYDLKFYGRWSYSNIIEKVDISDWQYVVTQDHEDGLKNWQFQASYAEEGKKKEVVSYFDGSLRNRQTVTRINTNDKIIAGEVIYDKEGRPAVEVLPVPIEGNPVIKYYPELNKNDNTVPLVYSYQDLPGVIGGLCAFTPTGMSVTSGASKYYSTTTVTNSYQDYVPDALKYPFSQTEYTNDNTGRIKRKGGVGPAFQVGSGHEMKYFYSVPNQKELNRLFGYSVGNVSHYKKNMVVDPNGQASVTYIDPQGRTIATGLSSGSPTNLISLPDAENVNLHLKTEASLLGKIDSLAFDTDFDNNVKYISRGIYGNLRDGLRYDGYKALISQAPGSSDRYNFQYSLKNQSPFSFDCGTFTYLYPYIYDLDLDVTDDCGESKYHKNTTLGQYTVSEDIVTMATAGSTLSNITPFSMSLPLGTYGFSKKLVVNSDALEIFTNDYIRRGLLNGCIQKP